MCTSLYCACLHCVYLCPIRVCLCTCRRVAQATAGVADWLVAVDLAQLLPLVSDAHAAVRAFTERVQALPAYAAAVARMAAVDAILRPDNSALDTRASVQKELSALLTEAFLKAYPSAKYVHGWGVVTPHGGSVSLSCRRGEDDEEGWWL